MTSGTGQTGTGQTGTGQTGTGQISIRDVIAKTQLADATFGDAFIPSRDLSFFTITVFIPIILISAGLLFGLSGRFLMGLSIVCGLLSVAGFSRLFYEITLDLVGYPTFRTPVWIVVYLILYVISIYTFLFFIVSNKLTSTNFIESYYKSLSGYIGKPTETNHRFLAISQTVLSTFIHTIIITKFISSF